MYMHLEHGNNPRQAFTSSFKSPENSKTLFAKNKQFLERQKRQQGIEKVLKLGE